MCLCPAEQAEALLNAQAAHRESEYLALQANCQVQLSAASQTTANVFALRLALALSALSALNTAAAHGVASNGQAAAGIRNLNGSAAAATGANAAAVPSLSAGVPTYESASGTQLSATASGFSSTSVQFSPPLANLYARSLSYNLIH